MFYTYTRSPTIFAVRMLLWIMDTIFLYLTFVSKITIKITCFVLVYGIYVSQKVLFECLMMHSLKAIKLLITIILYCVFQKSMKFAKSEYLVPADKIRWPILISCEPCSESNKAKKAVNYCNFCQEGLCVKCSLEHNVLKATKCHKLLNVSDNLEPLKCEKTCSTCKDNGKKKVASKICYKCVRFLCTVCSRLHAIDTETKHHKIHSIDDIPQEWCDLCLRDGKILSASQQCLECCKSLCTSCIMQHKSQRASYNHCLKMIITVPPDLKACDSCAHSNRECLAIRCCYECEEFYCDECCKLHFAQKATRLHTLVVVRGAANVSSTALQESRPVHETRQDTLRANILDAYMKHCKPGKPVIIDVKSDSVTMHWKPPRYFQEPTFYTVRYKAKRTKTWKCYQEYPEKACVTILDLQADTTYSFQVKAVFVEKEGPYSENSDEVRTKTSLASRIVAFSTKVKNDKPAIYQLNATELIKAHNKDAKTRAFMIGNTVDNTSEEKTILIVGSTGSGKSNLIDGIFNYILGVNWQDTFRFTVAHLEKKGHTTVELESQTEWITRFIVNPEEGGRVNYRLNIIDTPGFGSTDGLERDSEIVNQIKELFAATDDKGIGSVDAICFLIKAPDARLTAMQRYIFMSVLSLFGRDLENNICMLITFADGDTPPVLIALSEANIPFKTWHAFNNSGLYATNDLGRSSFGPLFWTMGYSSFKQFFKSLEGMTTNDLRQTRQVLSERELLRETMQALQPKLDAGFDAVNLLKNDIGSLKKYEKDVIENKDFEVEVEERQHRMTPLTRGRHVTNCLRCNVTCHEDCPYANDEDKKRCRVMDYNGNCKVCSGKCSWRQHCNTPYILRYVTQITRKTSSEKMRAYKNAVQQKQILEKAIAGEKSELKNIFESIQILMHRLNSCQERLLNIALWSDSLNMVDYIKMMIKCETMEKKEGFQRRIHLLQSYLKRAEMRKEVLKFQEAYQSVI